MLCLRCRLRDVATTTAKTVTADERWQSAVESYVARVCALCGVTQGARVVREVFPSKLPSLTVHNAT